MLAESGLSGRFSSRRSRDRNPPPPARPRLETNGELGDDGLMHWEFSPFDALMEPVELYAERRVGN